MNVFAVPCNLYREVDNDSVYMHLIYLEKWIIIAFICIFLRHYTFSDPARRDQKIGCHNILLTPQDVKLKGLELFVVVLLDYIDHFKKKIFV